MADQTSEIRIAVDVQGDVIGMVVAGDVDPSTAETFEGEVRAALFASPEATAMDLDLSEVSFMDSSGLRVVIGTLRSIRERGGTLTVRNPSSTVAQLLEVTRLSGELNVVTG